MQKLSLFFKSFKISLYNALPLPLDIWIYTFIISLSFLTFFYFSILETAPPPKTFTEYNSNRLQKLNNFKSPNIKKIVMLGDSRLRYATYDDKEMGELLTTKSNMSFQVVRITNDWAVFHDFSELTETILSVKPDLIIMQANLLSKGRADIANKEISREYFFWRYFKKGSWNPGDRNHLKLQHDMECNILDIEETVEERKERAFKWFHFKPGSLSEHEISKFLIDTNQNDIPVLYTSIPITAIAEQGLPSPPESNDKEILKIKEAISDEKFCDLVHMNEKGRNIFSEWLSTIIIDNLN